MEQVTNQEFSLRNKVIGRSTIDHRIRLDMKLSLEEYVLLDFIHLHNETKAGTIFFPEYYKETGFIKDDIQPLFRILKERGYLVFNTVQNRVDVCQQWKDIFSSAGLIDKLWRIHPKGNKPTAKKRLPLVLKMITMEELIIKLKAYVKHCDANGTFKKGLDVWLNSAKQHWEDPLVANPIQNNKPQQVQKVAIKFK